VSVEELFGWLLPLGTAMPALFLAAVGVPALFHYRMPERVTGALARTAFTASIVCFALVVPALPAAENGRIVARMGRWFGTASYHVDFVLFADALSLTFALFTAILYGVVSAFAHRYLHREPGYNRFFVLLSLLALGMLLTALGGSIELIFMGWELVGVSSALLIAFFHDRPLPIENGLRAFVAYRVADIGLVGAAVLIFHLYGSGELEALIGDAGWPEGSVQLGALEASAIALLMFFTAAGKSALLPFSSWLPRAMEGPTPSSAIFYGALSVHAGVLLMLRMGPLLDRAPWVAALVALVGLLTALYATVVGRVQTDIKCALAYASLTQIGIMYVEVGLGLRVIALLHLLGHASLRTLQYLRAPSLLNELHGVEDALGGRLLPEGAPFERLLPAPVRRRLYRFALERGYLEPAIDRLLVAPSLAFLRRLDRLERRVCARLAGARAEAAPRPSRADLADGVKEPHA
jgi:NAD(P)H-quinone oxidoreductase subunit 5